MQVYGVSQEELDQDKSDEQLRYLLESWPLLTRWEQYQIYFLARWMMFCRRFKIPGGIEQVGKDIIDLMKLIRL